MELRKIQEYECNMLKEFTELCDTNHICYYLAGGTLLGAVRHHGFIPWDDDIDINLTIKDYQRLRQVCKKQLPKYYIFQDLWNDRNHKYLWGRLKDLRTNIREKRLDGSSFENQLWIDVIPLIYAAKTANMLRFQVKVLYAWSYCARNQSKISEMKSKTLLVFAYRVIRELLIYRLGGNLLYWLSVLLQNKKSNKLIVLDVAFYDVFREENFQRIKQIMVDKEWLKGAKYTFEGVEYISFSDAHAYLKDHYGEDYMTPQEGRSHIDYLS